MDDPFERQPACSSHDRRAGGDGTVPANQGIRFLLQGRSRRASNDARDPAAVGEVAVRRVDDRVDRGIEQAAPDDAEDAAGRYFFFREDFFLRRGTFAPERRASDRPIAIACLRLFTFLPERPLRSVPRLRSCMAFFTFFCAFFP